VNWATQVSQQNNAMDALSARVAAMPGRKAATWVLDETQIKQGVSAGSIGRASKESWLEALAEQARSLGRKHWPSKQGVLARSIGRASKESQPASSVEQ
jgi:hypothetical protein